MKIKKVKISHFRNFTEVSLSFSPRLNFFVGENGQGKTNLLEALYLINQNDSFRISNNETLINKKYESAYITEEVEHRGLDYNLVLKISGSKKILSVNGKKISPSQIKKNFNCVIFSPESLSAIKESSEHRRRLIDELLISFERNNSDLIHDYRKALRTRNRVLKDNLEQKPTKTNFKALLESIDPTFLKLAIMLTMARIEALNGLKSELNNAMKYISKKSDVDISVEYVISGENAMGFNLQEITNAVQKRYLELRDAEIAAGTSLIGPHKHDILFLYGQNDSRFYCSQGQQRAIILSFKMAQIVYHRKVHGFYPILMLDDVLSELDENKRMSLIDFLHEINTQVFVTTTDLTLPEKFLLDESKVVKINNGQIFA